MAYIANSVILYNCKLNHNGLFTCDFGGSGATRDSVMGSTNALATVVASYDNCTWMRENMSITVGANADYLNHQGVNYCRFINNSVSGAGGRFTYAFIYDIEYVAEQTTRLYIRTDPFMTYFDQIIKNDCFVEREHVASDNFFEHTLPEPTPNFENVAQLLGDKHIGSQTTGEKQNYFYVGIYAVHDEDTTPIVPNVSVKYCGDVPSPGMMFLADAAEGQELMDTLITYKYSIEYAVFIPKSAVDTVSTNVSGVFVGRDKTENASWGGDPSFWSSGVPSLTTDTFTYANGTSHTIRNRKLNCYPYMYIEMNDINDQSVILKPEDMNGMDFYLHGEQGSTPTYSLYYKNYQGENNFANMITINSFPPVPVATDVYKQYAALNQNSLKQEKITFGVNVVKGIVGLAGSVVAGIATGGAAGAAYGSKIATGIMTAGASGMTGGGAMMFNAATANAASNAVNAYKTGGAVIGGVKGATQNGGGLVDTVMNRMQQNAMYSDMKDRPPQLANAPSGSAKLGLGAIGFHVNRWVPKLEYVEVLDKFFDMYGYNISLVKTPQWNSRSKYNYIKTSGANIGGAIPQNYKNQINELLDKGLTVWHSVGEYGTYSTSNPIV